jgi:hypothetical protein
MSISKLDGGHVNYGTGTDAHCAIAVHVEMVRLGEATGSSEYQARMAISIQDDSARQVETEMSCFYNNCFQST